MKKFFCIIAFVVFCIAGHAQRTATNKYKISFKVTETQLTNIVIPFPDGRSVLFNLSDNGLSGNLDYIKTYNGKSDTGETLKLTVSNDKAEAIIYTSDGYFILTPSKSNGEYEIYNLTDALATNFHCETNQYLMAETMRKIKRYSKSPASFSPYGDKLRVFRFAAATTGEMTSFMGSREAALSYIISMINITNMIYEKELAVSFDIIPQTLDLSLIFDNPDTDPFANYYTTASAVASQIGFDKLNNNNTLPYNQYDVAHTFHMRPVISGNYLVSGQAGPAVCIDEQKAHGWTQWTSGVDMGTVLNTFIHELGHQFAAYHTYNAIGGMPSNPTFCTVGRSDSNAVEPGAGSTLMAYGSNCTTPNIQSLTGDNKLLYFHIKNIESIQSLLEMVSGFSIIETGNTPPIVDAGEDITVPKSTPFKIRGNAKDPDNDRLTYTWEQKDVASSSDAGALGSNIPGTGGYPASLSATAPIFRSEQSFISERTFPKLSYILHNNNNPANTDGETLPEVARTLNFSLTVRDGRSGVNSDNMKIFVAEEGPLSVSYPNGGEVLYSGESLNVLWDVNSTDRIKDKVNILLSVDGGFTFPYILAENADNNGLFRVKLPVLPNTVKARVKVTAVINSNAEFFDISDGDFSVISSCSAFQSLPGFSEDIEVYIGDPVLNLNMVGYNAVSNIDTLSVGVVDEISNPIFVNQDVMQIAPVYVGNYKTNDILKLKVSKTGRYNIINSSGKYIIISVYNSNELSTNSFINSTGYIERSNILAKSQMTVDLNAYQDYYVVVSRIGTTGQYLITMKGDGAFYRETEIPTAYSYAYLAVNIKNNRIEQIDQNANFSSLEEGEYYIYGFSFPDFLDKMEFVGKDLSFVQNSYCIVLSETSQKVKVIDPSGIRLPEQKGSSIFIRDNILHIDSEYNIMNIILYDIRGEKLFDAINKTQINLSSLKSGMYILSLIDSFGNIYNEKIIKK